LTDDLKASENPKDVDRYTYVDDMCSYLQTDQFYIVMHCFFVNHIVITKPMDNTHYLYSLVGALTVATNGFTYIFIKPPYNYIERIDGHKNVYLYI
jgi:hypothetical protein